MSAPPSVHSYVSINTLVYNILPIENYKLNGYQLIRKKHSNNLFLTLDNENNSLDLFQYDFEFLHNLTDNGEIKYAQYFTKEFNSCDLFTELNLAEKHIEQLTEYFLQEITQLEKLLKIITNFDVVIPSFHILGKINGKTIDFSSITSRSPNEYISHIHKERQTLIKNRMNFNIDLNFFYNVNASYVNNSLDLYFSSFNIKNTNVKFVLLMSSLEALFNVDKKCISEKISKGVSKLLFLDLKNETIMKKKIKTYYNQRSNYIHGNHKYRITETDVNDLKEIVRKVLIIYLILTKETQIENAKLLLELICDKKKLSNCLNSKIMAIMLND